MDGNRRTDRFLDQRAAGDELLVRRARAPLLREVEQHAHASARFVSQPPSAARIIAWAASDAADQTITSTSYVAITGSAFDLGLGGQPGTRWLVELHGAALVTAWNAVDDEFYLRFETSVDGGVTWAAPDTNSTEQGAGGAWAWHDIGLLEAAGTGIFAQARCACAFFALPSDDLQVRLAARVGTGGSQSATVELTTTELAPKVMGTALAVRLE